MIPEVPHVGDSSHQRLDNDCECVRICGIQNFPHVSRRNEHHLRNRIMQPHHFALVNRLHLPPELADFLFLVIVREDFAEAFQRQHFRRYFVSPKNCLKLGRGPGHQAKPEVAGERRAGILQLMLLIEFPHGVHRRPLLLTQPLPHLRPKRRPMVRADIGFKACRDERAHRRKHRFAAVHRHCARRRCSMVWTHRGRRRRRGRSLRLHLRRGRRLPCRRQCYCRAQSRLKHSSYSFRHSHRRSSHSDQRLSLSAGNVSQQGWVCLRDEPLLSQRRGIQSIYRRPPYPSRNRSYFSLRLPVQHLPLLLASDNSEDAPKPGRVAPSDACRPHEKNRIPSCIGHRRGDFPSPTCGPARARTSHAAASIRQTGCAEFLSASRAFRQETPLPGDPAHRRTHMDGQRHRRAGR